MSSPHALIAASLLLAPLVASARAEDCDAMLASGLPVVLESSFALLWITRGEPTLKGGNLSFRIVPGDPVKVVQMIEPKADPTVETLYRGIFPFHMIELKSKRVTEYEYSSIEGSLIEGTEIHYTRVVKINGVAQATETGTVRVGQQGVKVVGDCRLEVVPIDSVTHSTRGPDRATHLLYAPRLGFFVEGTMGGLGSGNMAITYSAISLGASP
jgi:hypothetical protein